MRLWVVVAALFALSFAPPARADRFSLDYEASVFGVLDLGSLYVDMAVGEETYDAIAKVRSGGLLRVFERTDLIASATGAVGESIAWRRYDLDHSYSRKRRVTSLRMGPEGQVSAMITPNHRMWGNPPASEAHKREARDPLSSIIAMGHDIARTRQCNGSYATFDGRFRYNLVLSGGEVDRYDRAGFEGRVLKCTLRYEQVAGYDLRNENERRRYEGQAWFALIEDAAIAPPVRFLIPSPLGRAGVNLRKFRRAQVDVLPEDAPRPETAAQP
jgi:hypothetical protein